MIIYEPGGDIFESDAEAIVNPVNCMGTMGKGLAVEFKAKYPKMFRSYKDRCLNHKIIVGRCWLWETEASAPRWVVNFPTKFHWSDKSLLRWIEEGLDDFARIIVEHNIKSIAIPQIGCGLGGLAWSDVRALIIEKLGQLDVTITLYGPPASAAD